MIKIEDVDEFIECICEIFNIKRKLSFVETTELIDLYNNMWSTEKISYDDGYEAGYDAGKDDGYEDGYSDGLSEGKDSENFAWIKTILEMRKILAQCNFSNEKWSTMFKDLTKLVDNGLIDLSADMDDSDYQHLV